MYLEEILEIANMKAENKSQGFIVNLKKQKNWIPNKINVLNV